MSEYTTPTKKWRSVADDFNETEAFELENGRGCLVRTTRREGTALEFVPGATLADFGIEPLVECEPDPIHLRLSEYDHTEPGIILGQPWFSPKVNAKVFTIQIYGCVFSYTYPLSYSRRKDVIEHLNTQVADGPIERFYEDKGAIAYELRKVEQSSSSLSDVAAALTVLGGEK